MRCNRCDVSNREEVFKVADRVKEEVGNVTILINNAGIMPCHTFLDHSPEEIKRIFDVNVMAHFWVNCIVSSTFLSLNLPSVDICVHVSFIFVFMHP